MCEALPKNRYESDSMGEIEVPEDAYYGAQTQRAVNNFPVSGIRISRSLIQALGIIKKAAAQVNENLKQIPQEQAHWIQQAAQEVTDGILDSHFPIDIYQTGSGTSSNMNANEVIARRATELAGNALSHPIHPNDHVNFGQSSNDVIPTAIRIACTLEVQTHLLPALEQLREAFIHKGKEYSHVVKTGRTHLMDAMPVSFEQEFGGYARQLELAQQRIRDTLVRLAELPQGGTAVGTGINTLPEFPGNFAKAVSEITGTSFIEAHNHFESQGTVDAPVELSGQLKSLAVGLLKIVNDLRWMNSGPNSGLGDIQLAALQPGSSIMPGKVNPVIEESVAMVCAQVIGYDSAVTVGGLSGNFELNVMLPMVAHSVLEAIRLFGNACQNLAERSVSRL